MSTKTVDAGETAVFSGTLKDSSGAAIPASAVSSITCTMKNAATGTIINSRNAQDVLNANGGALDNSTGAFVWTTGTLDSTLEDSTAEVEEHQADFKVVGSFGVLEFQHRLRCLGQTMFLCRFDDVALYRKGLSEDQDREIVEMLIESFTRRVEEECNRIMRKSTAANPTVDVFSPPPRANSPSAYSSWWSVRASRWPVDSVISIKEDLGGDFTNATAWDTTDYAISDPKEGIIRARWNPFMVGVGSLQVRSVGGFALNTGAVRGDVREAAAKQVAFWHQRMDDLGAKGISLPDGSVQLITTGPWLDEVKPVVNSLKPMGF